ncbi:coiled-coil domain-containing protein 136 isoform X2 [Electrophorus electricus]|uniref:coiled-coil domain-containing protein 136 isoform X2 n=1 Tax=Electrophorus electricus TaxID=8005 RepID=UPI0015CFE109|nr:coiled-coil domain-containing protein 136 isoform X2 [Electrophorus electricus]
MSSDGVVPRTDKSSELKTVEALMEKQEKAEQAEHMLCEQVEQVELEDLRAQVLQLLVELEEVRDASQKQDESGAELQGLLEDERLASAHQAEAFTLQIQCLQAQLQSAQEELDALDEQKERELAEAQEEVRVAREEVRLLQQGAEEAAGERENDIASLQEELCRLRAELGCMESSAQEYELEMVTLRAEIAMKSQRREQERREGERREGEMEQLRGEYAGVKAECETLKQANSRLAQRLQLIQCTGSESTGEAVKPEGSGSNHRLVDVCIQKNISFEDKPLPPGSLGGGFSEVLSLRDQLKQAEERAEQVQRQCDRVRTDLRELQDLFETSQKERAELELELLHCREELEKITDGSEQQSSTQPSVLSLPFLGMTVIVAVLWCCWCELAV